MSETTDRWQDEAQRIALQFFFSSPVYAARLRDEILVLCATVEQTTREEMRREQEPMISFRRDEATGLTFIDGFAEALRAQAGDIQAAPPATPRCDCGAVLTCCASCAVADYQSAHPECATCCRPIEAAAPPASRSKDGLWPDADCGSQSALCLSEDYGFGMCLKHQAAAPPATEEQG